MGGEAVKKWCIGNSSSEARQWCVQLPKTIREKIKKAISSNWEEKVKAIKGTDTSNLLQDLKTIDNSLTQVLESEEKVRSALKGWCESKLDVKLVEEGSDAIYTKVENRCLEE